MLKTADMNNKKRFFIKQEVFMVSERLLIEDEKFLNEQTAGYVLKDDIWDKGALLIKSGTYLTERIIRKLLNFGVKRVNISYEESSLSTEIDLESHVNSIQFYNYSLKQFISSQSVLIVEKSLINASLLVRELIDMGFKDGNIFVTKEPSYINSYFRAKQINFLFIDKELHEKCTKCVEKYSYLRNTHVFLMAHPHDLIELYRNVSLGKIKFLLKDEIEDKLKMFVNQGLHQNYLDFWSEEELIS
jgi:hypothetical protein